jgi:hypothetical protein
MAIIIKAIYLLFDVYCSIEIDVYLMFICISSAITPLATKSKKLQPKPSKRQQKPARELLKQA